MNEATIYSKVDKTFLGYTNLADHILYLNPNLI